MATYNSEQMATYNSDTTDTTKDTTKVTKLVSENKAWWSTFLKSNWSDDFFFFIC